MSRAPVAVEGARVGVLGLARSGVAVARLLAARGARVFASDVQATADVEEAAARLAREGVDVETGGHDVERLAACDWIVPSPGIPPAAPVLRDPGVARQPRFAEIEVASWFAEAPIAAVTGTNGKTTTTALLGAMAEAAGLAASVAGNIGRPFSAAVARDPAPDWFVLEASSFQLGAVATFRPRVAVVLNLTPDHLDVYSDFAAYAADKARIAENMDVGDHLCLNAEDPAVAEFGASRPTARHWFDRHGEARDGATVLDGWLTLREPDGTERRVLRVERIRIPGAHNLQNALAATLAAHWMGIPPAAAAGALETFPGVPHRLETVARVHGVTWVNDSKATNVDSALVALEAFDQPLIVILGGRHKGSPYAPLAGPLSRRGRAVLAIGEAAPRIIDELDEAVSVEDVGTLERAVERARELARPGDVVLLSPACSSYDQFADYEERGDRFRALAAGATTPAGGGS